LFSDAKKPKKLTEIQKEKKSSLVKMNGTPTKPSKPTDEKIKKASNDKQTNKVKSDDKMVKLKSHDEKKKKPVDEKLKSKDASSKPKDKSLDKVEKEVKIEKTNDEEEKSSSVSPNVMLVDEHKNLNGVSTSTEDSVKEHKHQKEVSVSSEDSVREHKHQNGICIASEEKPTKHRDKTPNKDSSKHHRKSEVKLEFESIKNESIDDAPRSIQITEEQPNEPSNESTKQNGKFEENTSIEKSPEKELERESSKQKEKKHHKFRLPKISEKFILMVEQVCYDRIGVESSNISIKRRDFNLLPNLSPWD
jgi:hypothetical protein